MTLSTVAVENTGAYKVSDIGWFHGETLAEVQGLKAKGRRVTVTREYKENGVLHFIGVTVPMTGADDRDWRLLSGTVGSPPEIPSGYRPSIVTTDINTGGDHVAVLVVANPEGFICEVNYNNTPKKISTLPDANKGLIDATALDDGSGNFATIFCDSGDAIGGAEEFFGDLTALFQDASGAFRPLFMTQSTDFEPQWLTSFGDDF